MRKYEFTGEEKQFDGRTLRRIRAVRDFGRVKAGDLGGWIEAEGNLSHDDECWVYGNAQVRSNAQVCGNAWVYGNAQVYGKALVYDNAQVCGNALVYGRALMSGNAWVYGNARVYGNSWVHGNARVYGSSRVYGNADIFTPNHVVSIENIGSRNDTTTFFRTRNNDIYVVCGCFFGDLQTFLEKVNETHGNNRHGMVYRLAAELARTQIGSE